MDIGIILIGIIVVLLLDGIFSEKEPLTLHIKSRCNGDTYIAIKKNRKRGYSVDEWYYYDSDGNEILDKWLKTIIHNSFVNEDWYGQINFYADDIKYYKGKDKLKTSKLTEVN